MKRLKYLIPIIALLLFSHLWSCEKLSDNEKEEIERYKNSHRDSQIFGQWEYISSVTGEVYIVDFKRDGRMIVANPAYNENGDIIHFKKNNSETYYYTENDSILYKYEVIRSFIHSSISHIDIYEIDGDTLYRYNDIGYFFDKGVRTKVKLLNR